MSSPSPDEGGTKIQRRAPVPPPTAPSNLIPPGQGMHSMPMAGPMAGPPQQAMSSVPPPIFKQKSSFGVGGGMGKGDIKYPILVVLIFILLNSKIVWTQIARLPFMGSVEPSLVALIVNSILAGVVFYCFKTFVFRE